MENKRLGFCLRALLRPPYGRSCFWAMAWLAAMVVAPGLAPAQTSPTYSVNAVGFTKMTVHRQGLYQLHCPFTKVNEGAAGTAPLMMSRLPNGSSLIGWDSAAQDYGRAKEVKLLGAWSPGTNSLYGQAFWLYVGNSATQETFDVIFCGQVPDARTMPTSTVHLASTGDNPAAGNLNLVGFAYPCPIAWTNTTFAENAGRGSSVIMYDSAQHLFVTYTKTGTDWSGNFTVQPGHGFWLRAFGLDAWVEPKPYDWP